MFPWQPIEYRTPGPKLSELPFFRLDTLARWIFPERGVFVLLQGCPSLLKLCINPNPSDRMGLLENQTPGEGSHQHWVPGNRRLTSLEILRSPSPASPVGPVSPGQWGPPCCSPMLPGDKAAQVVPGHLSVPEPKLGTWEASCLNYVVL